MFHRTLGVMDMNLYDYESIFETNFQMNKSKRLEYGDSLNVVRVVNEDTA